MARVSQSLHPQHSACPTRPNQASSNAKRSTRQTTSKTQSRSARKSELEPEGASENEESDEEESGDEPKQQTAQGKGKGKHVRGNELQHGGSSRAAVQNDAIGNEGEDDPSSKGHASHSTTEWETVEVRDLVRTLSDAERWITEAEYGRDALTAKQQKGTPLTSEESDQLENHSSNLPLFLGRRNELQGEAGGVATPGSSDRSTQDALDSQLNVDSGERNVPSLEGVLDDPDNENGEHPTQHDNEAAGTGQSTEPSDDEDVEDEQVPATTANTRRPSAGRKRRKGVAFRPRKTQKQKLVQPMPPRLKVHPENYEFDRREKYKIKGIVAVGKKEGYVGWCKVRWAKKSPRGVAWADTWVPMRYTNSAAKRDWEARKLVGRENDPKEGVNEGRNIRVDATDEDSAGDSGADDANGTGNSASSKSNGARGKVKGAKGKAKGARGKTKGASGRAKGGSRRASRANGRTVDADDGVSDVEMEKD